MEECTMFTKRSPGRNLIDYSPPAEQRPWRVQFDEMHICLAALTVHLLRIHKLFYTRYIYYGTLFYILYSVILLSSQFTSWEDKNANKNIRYKHFAKLAHFWPSQFPSRERVKKHFAKFAHFFSVKTVFWEVRLALRERWNHWASGAVAASSH